MNIPYTYLIGWSELNKWYYGVRFAKNCHPYELGKKYFTSSKHVKKFIEENGKPDIIEIRKTFNSVNKAREWEHKVLRRMKVVLREDFLNKTDNKSIALECVVGSKSEETKRKISETTIKTGCHRGANNYMFGKKGIDCPNFGRVGSMRGKIHPEETKLKISISLSGNGNPMWGKFGENHPAYGTTRTEETKKIMSAQKTGSNNPMFGRPISQETINKRRETKRKNREKNEH